MRSLIAALLLSLLPLSVAHGFSDNFEVCELPQFVYSPLYDDVYWTTDLSSGIDLATVFGVTTNGDENNECILWSEEAGSSVDLFMGRQVTDSVSQVMHVAAYIEHLPFVSQNPFMGFYDNDGACPVSTCTSGDPPADALAHVSCSKDEQCDTAGCYATFVETALNGFDKTALFRADLFYKTNVTLCDQGSRNPYTVCTDNGETRDPSTCAETQDGEARCIKLPIAQAIFNGEEWEEIVISQDLALGTATCRLFAEGFEAGGGDRPTGTCAFDGWACFDNNDCAYLPSDPDLTGRCSDWALSNPYPVDESELMAGGSKVRCATNTDCRTCSSDSDCGGVGGSCHVLSGRCVCEANDCTVPTLDSTKTNSVWFGPRYHSDGQVIERYKIGLDDWAWSETFDPEDMTLIRIVNDGPDATGSATEWNRTGCNSTNWECVDDYVAQCEGGANDEKHCTVAGDCPSGTCETHGADDSGNTQQNVGVVDKRFDVEFPSDVVVLATEGTCANATATAFGSCTGDSTIKCFEDTDCVETIDGGMVVSVIGSAKDGGESGSDATDDNGDNKTLEVYIYDSSGTDCATAGESTTNCPIGSDLQNIGEFREDDWVPFYAASFPTAAGGGVWTEAKLDNLGIRFKHAGPDANVIRVTAVGIAFPINRLPAVKPRWLVEQGTDSEITVGFLGDSLWAPNTFHNALSFKVQQPVNLCEHAAGGKTITDVLDDPDGDGVTEFERMLECEQRTSLIGTAFAANMLRGSPCNDGAGTCDGLDYAVINLSGGNDLHKTLAFHNEDDGRCWDPDTPSQHGNSCSCPVRTGEYCLGGAASYANGNSAQSTCQANFNARWPQQAFAGNETNGGQWCTTEDADWSTTTDDTCSTNSDCDNVTSNKRFCIDGQCACCGGTENCPLETFSQICQGDNTCTGKFWASRPESCTTNIDCAIPPLWCAGGCIDVDGCEGSTGVCVNNSIGTVAGVVAQASRMMDIVEDRNSNGSSDDDLIAIFSIEHTSGPSLHVKRCSTSVGETSTVANWICEVDADCGTGNTCEDAWAHDAVGLNACWDIGYREELRAGQAIREMAEARGHGWLDIQAHYEYACPHQTPLTCSWDGRHQNGWGDDISTSLIRDMLTGEYGDANGLCDTSISMCVRGRGCVPNHCLDGADEGMFCEVDGDCTASTCVAADPTETCPAGGFGDYCTTNADCDTYRVDLN